MLVRHTAPIAGNANDIECLKPLNGALRKEIIIYPDIVMNKDEDCIASIGMNSRIVDIGKAGAIVKCYVRNMRHLLFESPQRETQSRSAPELTFGESCSTNYFDRIGGVEFPSQDVYQ